MRLRGALWAVLTVSLVVGLVTLAGGRPASVTRAASPLPDKPLFAIGAQAATGEFNAPSGVALAGDGAVYVADTNNHRIQVFSAAGAFLRTFGAHGGGEGQFHVPDGVAVGGDGTVYVADAGNHRIQRFTSAGAYLGQWGGEGTDPGRFSFPHGLAIGPDGTLYVTDSGNHRVQHFNAIGAYLGSWGVYGTGNSQFDSPYGVAVAADGTVYVTDRGNHRIQAFDATGTFLRAWGTSGSGNSQFAYPHGIAVRPGGLVYVADRDNNRVQVFSATGVFQTAWGVPGGGDGEFAYPQGIVVTGAGIVYVADTDNHRLQTFSGTGVPQGRWGVYGSGTGQFDYPFGIAAGPDGFYVADTHHSRIQRFSSTGAFLATWGSLGAGNGLLNNPRAVAVAADGTVYVADTQNHRIQFFSATGAYLGGWGAEGVGSSQFSYPGGLTVAPDTSVYVADTYNHRIQRFSATGTFLGAWGFSGADPGQFFYPQGLAVTSDGTVYVADTGNNRIERFTAWGVYLGQWGGGGAGPGELSTPTGLALSADGSLYVADAGNLRIQRFSLTGEFQGMWGELGGGPGQFNNPSSIAIAPNGAVYVSDAENQRVQAFGAAYPTTWRGEYFGNRWLAGRPLLIEAVSALSFAWGIGAPGAGVPADNFGSRFEQTAWFESDTYRFTVQSDDGVRLWVDNRLLFDQWTEGPANLATDLGMLAGFHRVRVEQFDATGTAGLTVNWQGSNTPTPTMTPSAIASPTGTRSPTPTVTRTASPSTTPPPTLTPTRTLTPGVATVTATRTPSPSATATASPTASATPTRTPTATRTSTPTATSLPGDAYEDDDACSRARTIATDGTAQTHTFHRAGDQDWVKFTAAANKTYIIQTANTGPRSDGVVFLYDSCSGGALGSNDNAFGQTVRLEWDITHAGAYYVKLQQHDPTIFGTDTNYDLSVTIDTTPPAAPRNPRCASLDATTLSMQWQAGSERDVVRYRLAFHDADFTEGGARDVDGADITYYELSGLTTGKLYYLKVSAFDFSGNASADSAEIFCRPTQPADTTKPVLTVQQPTSETVFTTTLPAAVLGGAAQDSGGNLSRVRARNAATSADAWDYSLQGGSDDFRIESITLVPGDNQLTITAFDTAGNTGVTQLTIHRLAQSPGAAIVLAGHNETFGLQANLANLANRAYRLLQGAGFDDDHIFYLAPESQDPDGDGVSEVDAPASPANLQTALATWAVSRTGSDRPLQLFLFDHGEIEAFCADGCADPGAISSDQLDGWLTTLEAASGVSQINVVIEACHSGSFVDRLGGAGSITRAGRVVIASTDRDHNAYASAQGAYFSDAFLSCLAASGNLKACFDQAKTAVATTGVSQTPWLDDNGDGLASTGDGTIAQTRAVAAFFGGNPPVIASRAVTLTGASGTLAARVTAGGEPIELVWAAVYGPTFHEPTGTTLNLGVPTVRLDPVAGQPGTYGTSYPNGFSDAGPYRIVFYAEDRAGLQALPVVVTLGSRRTYLPFVRR